MGKFGFKAKIHKLSISPEKMLKTTREKFEIMNRQAAREWLRAIFIRIPVWTGMARGGLKYAKGRSGPSAGLFLSNYLQVSIAIGPRRTYDGEGLQVRPDKSPELGGKQSRYTFAYYHGKFTFTYQTDIYYLLENDLYGGKPPSYTRPWGALDAGNRAYNDYIANNKHKVAPKVSDFLVTTQIPMRE